MKIEAINPDFAATVTAIDLRQPLGDAAMEEMRQAMGMGIICLRVPYDRQHQGRVSLFGMARHGIQDRPRG